MWEGYDNEKRMGFLFDYLGRKRIRMKEIIIFYMISRVK